MAYNQKRFLLLQLNIMGARFSLQ